MNNYDLRKSIFNLDNIKKEFDNLGWEDDINQENLEVKRSFLGTVFAIMPSGKYYTFWTSNQTKKDVERDEMFIRKAEEELLKIDVYLESGEGDPCDLFLVQYRDKEEQTSDIEGIVTMLEDITEYINNK